FWGPMVDQVDWDGALTHHVGKIHNVGVYTLQRQTDGNLLRTRSPLADQFAKLVRSGNDAVGELAPIITPFNDDDQAPPLGQEMISAAPAPRAGTGAAAESAAIPATTGHSKAALTTTPLDEQPRK